MVDFLKSRGVTGIFTHLAHSQEGNVATDAGLSSLMDGWVLMLNREINGEFNRELYLLKARGMPHSNQVREFIMSAKGIQLLPPYLGESGALTGTARRAEEARSRRAEASRRADVDRMRRQIDTRRRKALAQIEALQAELEADEMELQGVVDAEARYQTQASADAEAMIKSRRG
jgi:circadian clock protein KaiC